MGELDIIKDTLKYRYNNKFGGYTTLNINKLPNSKKDLENILIKAELIQQILKKGGYSTIELEKKQLSDLTLIWKNVYHKNTIFEIKSILEKEKRISKIRSSIIKKNKKTITKKETSDCIKLKKELSRCGKSGMKQKTHVLTNIHSYKNYNYKPS
jgi:hypothetical protein